MYIYFQVSIMEDKTSNLWKKELKTPGFFERDLIECICNIWLQKVT